jgi:hypothetical protein
MSRRAVKIEQNKAKNGPGRPLNKAKTRKNGGLRIRGEGVTSFELLASSFKRERRRGYEVQRFPVQGSKVMAPGSKAIYK